MKENRPVAFEDKRIQNPPPIKYYDEAEHRADAEAHSGRRYNWPTPPRPKETMDPLSRFLENGEPC